MSAAPIKVLVVDDEPPIRKLLRMGLSTQGYEIIEAMHGTIVAENQRDRTGACFTISLPVPAEAVTLDTAA